MRPSTDELAIFSAALGRVTEPKIGARIDHLRGTRIFIEFVIEDRVIRQNRIAILLSVSRSGNSQAGKKHEAQGNDATQGNDTADSSPTDER